MWHFQPQYCLSYLDAWECALDSHSHFLGENLVLGYLVVVHVEDIVYFAARNYEGMTLHQWVDVEKSIELVVLGALVAGYLASCDF